MTKVQYTIDGYVIKKPNKKTTPGNSVLMDFFLSRFHCCSNASADQQVNFEDTFDDLDISVLTHRHRNYALSIDQRDDENSTDDDTDDHITPPVCHFRAGRFVDDLRVTHDAPTSAPTGPRDSSPSSRESSWDCEKIASDETDTTVGTVSEDDESDDCERDEPLVESSSSAIADEPLEIHSTFSAHRNEFPPILLSSSTFSPIQEHGNRQQ